jgi:hypothetical protein
MRIAKTNLKKQSQFVPAGTGAKSFVKRDYENKQACRAERNKANQSRRPARVLRTLACR